MVTTSRTFYEPVFKVKVLDHVRDLGSVSEAARRHQLEPGLVYSWKAHEKDIRKAARKGAMQGGKSGGKPPESAAETAPVAKRPPPLVSPSLAKKSLEPPHPDGPEVAVRALGPWLEGVVKRELPTAIDGQLEGLVREKFVELEAKLTELVRAEFRAFVSKGVG